MSDFFLRIHAKRLELASQISGALFYQLPTNSMSGTFRAANTLLNWFSEAGKEVTGEDLAEMDSSALNCLILSEMFQETLKAINGYAEWMACALIRSGLWAKQRLPMLNDEALQKIADKYNVKVVLLKRVVEYLEWPGTEIPPLGQIESDRELVTNQAALKEWASHYTW